MPVTEIYWEWQEAFDKFGFGDGDGLVMTYVVADFIKELGYEVEADGWGMHNTIITEIKKGDTIVMDENQSYDLGYDDPRGYLPKDFISALDKRFPSRQYLDHPSKPYYPEHKLQYSTDMVCRECDSNEWHVNMTYNNRNGGWFYGEIDMMEEEQGPDVWCHDCESWRDLRSPYEEGEVNNAHKGSC